MFISFFITVPDFEHKETNSTCIFLGIPAIDQDIIKNDFPCDTVKRSYQMLCEWFINYKPEEHTVETLRKAFKDAECFAALEYLSLDER
ncbi:Hypothetical predicted protein [Octopus vulgaris]|uniref:Uncharacterized protein n=1 Tax=Octopus vulgaris TaxID=6645 RepID=A0AA36AZA6_OCTVU|nr:Hypothetical predicted protein [Octopus vulgaris]